MKNFYPATLYAISAIFFSAICLTANAQAIPTTYTAVQAGTWHTASGPGIWAAAEPPMNCVSCTIVLNVPTNATITLNTHVVLSGNSQLVIGGGSNGTTVFIPNSGATDSGSSYSINLMSDGTTNSIQLINNSSFVNVASNGGHAGDYDGLFTSSVTSGVVSSLKSVGNQPIGFTNGAITNLGTPQDQSITGPKTLIGNGILPIILGNFTGTVNDGAVDLAWTTDLEVNADHFTIQRSADAGATWTDLGNVAAHGTTSVAQNYTYSDNKPVQGTAEYRLELVDKGGQYTYSSVISVRIGIVTSVSVYPNPARDYVNVTLGGATGESMLIRLFNQAGQLLQEKNVTSAGGTIVPLAVSNYPEGNYVIVVSAADGSRQINKLVITK
ncbi:MAG TPA: T9SS type A sorting domain-containing protein [Puia sp.]|nr:T9SS type A sorting domain-containing protein [Puia sp.]